MEEKDIIPIKTGNMLIAQYMGGALTDVIYPGVYRYKNIVTDYKWDEEKRKYNPIVSDKLILRDQLEYHSSFSALMPVIGKIARENGNHVSIVPSELGQKTSWCIIEANLICPIQRENKSWVEQKTMINSHDENLIDAIWTAVVEWINWQYPLWAIKF